MLELARFRFIESQRFCDPSEGGARLRRRATSSPRRTCWLESRIPQPARGKTTNKKGRLLKPTPYTHPIQRRTRPIASITVIENARSAQSPP
jgi:hypothetical protein